MDLSSKSNAPTYTSYVDLDRIEMLIYDTLDRIFEAVRTAENHETSIYDLYASLSVTPTIFAKAIKLGIDLDLLVFSACDGVPTFAPGTVGIMILERQF